MAQPLELRAENEDVAKRPPGPVSPSKSRTLAVGEQKQRNPGDDEFERRKALARNSGLSNQVGSVAAFLVAISRQNMHEGRDPTLVCDSLQCGTVADFLSLDSEALSRALLALQNLGLIESHETGSLRLKDIGALERVAHGRLKQVEVVLKRAPAGAAALSQTNNLAGRYSSALINELKEVSRLLLSVGGLSVLSVCVAALAAAAMF